MQQGVGKIEILSFTTKCKVQIFYNFEKEFFKTKFQISGYIGTARRLKVPGSTPNQAQKNEKNNVQNRPAEPKRENLY